MKTIREIIHRYDVLTLKEGKERGQLVALSNMGFLDEHKIDLVSTALKLEGNALSEAEKNSLNDLIQSLSSYVLSEANDKYTSSSDKSIPIILLLKRKAIRVFPGDTKVGLYYSQTLDRYISIPFGSKGAVDNTIMTEQKSSQKSSQPKKPKGQNSNTKYTDDDVSKLPPDLQKLHKDNAERDRTQRAAQDIIDKTPDKDVHKIKGKFGLTAARIATHRYDSRGGNSSIAGRAGAKLGIGAHVLLKKAVSTYKERGEKKQQAAQDAHDAAQAKAAAAEKENAQKAAVRNAELKKHTDIYARTTKYAKDAGPRMNMPTNKAKKPERASMAYARLATHAKNRIKQLGGTVPKVNAQKRVVGPISSPKPGVVKPPALAEGAVSWVKNKIRDVRTRLANRNAGKIKRPNTGEPVKNDSSSKPERTSDSAHQSNYKGSSSSSPVIDNSYSQRVSVDQHHVRQNRAAWGSDPYGKQSGQQNESNLNVIRKIAESNLQKAEIEFTDKNIPLNYGIARKFMAVYESLNTKNKEKVESMLNESSMTCSKAINFAIRS